MANIEPCKSNTKADPNYPFRSYRNDAGEIVYNVPIEAPEDRTLDIPIEEYEKLHYMMLSFKSGRKIRVFFYETTDKEIAYEQKAWFNTMASSERRYSRRFQSIETIIKAEPGDCIWDYSPAMRSNEDGYTIADYSDLPEQIEELIKTRYQNSVPYLQVYRMSGYGFKPKQIAEMLGINQAMVYYYRKEALRIAQEYRRRYFDEGQYTFP